MAAPSLIEVFVTAVHAQQPWLWSPQPLRSRTHKPHPLSMEDLPGILRHRHMSVIGDHDHGVHVVSIAKLSESNRSRSDAISKRWEFLAQSHVASDIGSKSTLPHPRTPFDRVVYTIDSRDRRTEHRTSPWRVPRGKAFVRCSPSFENNGQSNREDTRLEGAGYNHSVQPSSATSHQSPASIESICNSTAEPGVPKGIKRMRYWGWSTSIPSPTALGYLRIAMVSLSLVILGLATIGAYTKPTVRPSRGLELSLSTPANKVTSPSDLRVAATVKNAGDEDLKILKPGTVLDNEHPTPAFIVRKDGKEVPFIGITVRAPAFMTLCVFVNIHVGSQSIRPPRTAPPRMIGLSSPPARM